MRKVSFKEAYAYGQRDSFKLLQYLTLILRVFNLEYFMGRNSTPGMQVMEMEGAVNTGREFWSKIEQRRASMDIRHLHGGSREDELRKNQLQKGTASEAVINRIFERKKNWTDLQEDMACIQDRLWAINSWMAGLPTEKRNAAYLCDMLILQHHSTYYQFLNGLENILDFYRNNNNDEYFRKVTDIREAAIRKQTGLILNMRNGFYIS